MVSVGNLVTLITLKCMTADEVLDMVESQYCFLSHSPKNWLAYVDFFLLIKTKFSAKISAIDTLGFAFSQSSCFLSRASHAERFLLMGKEISERISDTVKAPVLRMVVQTLHSQSVCICQTKLECLSHAMDDTWSFDVHPELNLNVSLEEIFIPVKYFERCFVEKLQFYRSRKEKVCKSTVGCFLFCGKYSSLHLYFAANRGHMLLAHRHFAIVSVKLTFSVMDKGVISHTIINQWEYWFLLRTRRIGVSRPSQLTSLVIQKSAAVLMYLVRVIEDSKIKIDQQTSSSKPHVEVFDGPLCSMPVVKLVNNSFLTTSFQCVVHIHMNDLQIDKALQNLQFQSKLLKPSEEHNISQSTPLILALPNKHCLVGLCLVRLSEITRANINMTVLQLKTTAPEHPFCLFGGIVFLGEGYFLDNICKGTEDKHSQRKSQYFRKGDGFIVLYWFGKFSVDASVVVKATSCEIVMFDPCKARKECARDKARCAVFLYPLKLLGLGLKHEGKHQFSFAILSDKCLTLQIRVLDVFRVRKRSRYSSHCFVSLLSEMKDTPWGENGQYELRGSQSSVYQSDCLKLTGRAGRVCVQQRNNSMECWLDNQVNLTFILANDTSSNLFASIESPASTHAVLHIDHLGFFEMFESWIDLKFEMKNSSEDIVEPEKFAAYHRVEKFSVSHVLLHSFGISLPKLDVSVFFRLVLDRHFHNQPNVLMSTLSSASNKYLICDQRIGKYFSKSETINSRLVQLFSQMVNFSKTSLQLVFSPHGFIENISIHSQSRTSLHIFLKSYIFKELLAVLENEVQEQCSAQIDHTYNFCVNFSKLLSTANERTSYNIYFSGKYRLELAHITRKRSFGKEFRKISQTISWNKASRLCTRFGGTLPVLRSKDELLTFAAELELSVIIPLVAVFLGLKQNESKKVSENPSIVPL